MDEYIKREDAIKMIENDLPEVVYYRKEDAIACLECLPTVDVVPRAEVDKIFKEIETMVFSTEYHKIYNKVRELKEKYIPTETKIKETKPTEEGDYFTPAEVRAMSAAEVKANYSKIITSMSRWH